jgi:hypothetical protein
MRSEPSSSSDTAGAGGRAGVAAPAPLPALDRLLDKCRVGTSELEGAEALGGVKILQHEQEELVEQSILL